MEWLRRLVKATSSAKNKEDIFAFALYAWSMEEGGEEVMARLSREPPGAAEESFQSEVWKCFHIICFSKGLFEIKIENDQK